VTAPQHPADTAAVLTAYLPGLTDTQRAALITHLSTHPVDGDLSETQFIVWVLTTALTSGVVPDDAVTALTCDRTAFVRAASATHSNLPDDALRRLAADTDAWVRSTVAGNPHTPPDVLLTLAHDPAPAVLVAVAANPNSPADALDYLAHTAAQRNHTVWDLVMAHPNVTEDAQVMLALNEPHRPAPF
jgi:hypothetical protein